jgi:hypothetical protein
MSIKDLAPGLPTEYLRNFFAEKDIPETTFEKVSRSGTTHFVDNAVVVEHLNVIEDESILRGIEDTLRKIDFRNGDVNHFLEHLAGAVVELFEDRRAMN